MEIAITLTLHRDPMDRVMSTENIQKGIEELSRLYGYLQWFLENQLLPLPGIHNVCTDIVTDLETLKQGRGISNYDCWIQKFKKLKDRTKVK